MAEILIADDETPSREWIAELLRRHGYRPNAVESARLALERLSERAYGMVITDLSMPDMDGIELVSQAARIAPKTPIIAVSGRLPASSGPIGRLLRSKGAAFLLRKPVEANELLASVRVLMHRIY